MKTVFTYLMNHKKITIPITIFVTVLTIGAVIYGIAQANEPVTSSSAVHKKKRMPEYICYDQAGTYSDKNTYKAGDIAVDEVVVENATFDTLTITEGVGDGSATLNDVTVKKTLVINGGGTNSVHINGGSYKEVISNDYDCHIVIDEKCSVDTLTVPSSALVEVNGTVKVANVVPSSYEGDVTWECGFKAGEKANVESLNIAEEVKKDVKVEDTTGKAVKEQKALTKAETNKVQNNAQSATSTVQNTTSNAKQEVVSGGGNTSATNPSSSGNTSSNNGNNSGSSSSNSNTNTGSNKPSGGSTSSNTPSKPSATNTTCPTCGEKYPSNTTHSCSYGTCSVCGEKVLNGSYHDCPYTWDAYGNKVRKDSRYVVAVGGYGTKKYSDGTYEVTDEGRNALRENYAIDLMELQGAGIEPTGRFASLDAYVISCSGI